KRSIEEELIRWKDSTDHLPLIVRGARQVGKSFTIEMFGKTHFSNTVIANFEEKTIFTSAFETFEIPDILNRLSNLSGQAIIPGKTLIFLDEIQNCVPALKALRYFKEKLPALHVIAAGSFLEFVLEDEPGVSFPVGRVQFINMKPLSFTEFMQAIGQGGLNEMLETTTIDQPLSEVLHQHLLRYVRDFFFVGAMPAVVAKFQESNSYQDCLRLQASILDFYRLDLAKYAQKSQYKHLHTLFHRIPELVGQHFKYSKIDPHSANPARDYKNALHKLELAKLIHLVSASSANGPPLHAELDSKKFKVFFLDIGLLQYAVEITPEDRTFPLSDIHRGILAEQFVAQELLAYIDPFFDRHLFFWSRDKKGSEAEVDFLINVSGQIVPIEVKSGQTGKLKSLQQFLTEKNSKIGVKISEAPLKFEKNVLSLPFYMISQLSRLLAKIL
ncbi:MAG: ATP-binding protein, partial [Parachlamydia sp.]|nr:ATP-binding protein [Parachlamydia sp.]